mmetsp:Transcript_9093/g.11826  ORF Transcript_9093/g.11826 Transcript_9093/m.11826 type:complete len:211 (-) Transcript_9093:1341-1973(-)
MDINLSAAINLTRVFLPTLRQETKAHIVNISSMYGLLPTGNGSVAYHTSKFGLAGFTQSLSLECQALCPNVVCHTVHPGFVKTSLLKNGLKLDTTTLSSGEKRNAEKAWDIITVTESEEVAKSVLSQMLAEERFIVIGPDAYLNYWISTYIPRGVYLNNVWISNILLPWVHFNSFFASKIKNVLGVGDKTSIALFALSQYFLISKVRSLL